jgi:hypothetical protein
MKKDRRLYSHINKTGIKMMEKIRPGALLRVSWIEDPEADAEWGLDMIYFEDAEEQNNIVLLVEWMPYINNAKNIITFKCLHEDKLYFSSTNALLEIIR